MPETVTAAAGSQTWIPFAALLVALLSPTIATVVGVWLANRNANRARVAAERTEAKLDVATARTDDKLEVIRHQTNGGLEAAHRKIDALERRLFEQTGETPHPESVN